MSHIKNKARAMLKSEKTEIAVMKTKHLLEKKIELEETMENLTKEIAMIDKEIEKFNSYIGSLG